MKLNLTTALLAGTCLAAGAWGAPVDGENNSENVVIVTVTETVTAEQGAETTPIPSATTISNESSVVVITEVVTVTGEIEDAHEEATDEGAEQPSAENENTVSEDIKEEDTAQAESESQSNEQPVSEEKTPNPDVPQSQPVPAASDSDAKSDDNEETVEENDGGSDTPSGEVFSGDGTYFTPGLGSCGLTNTDDDLIVAINAPQYGTTANPNQAPVCGQCILAKGPKGEVKVTVTDRCPVCKSGDLDFSPSAFEKIGDFDDGRIPITWQFVNC
ncbi:hypothetical protein GGI07_005543 [Coemansia sp. Benny D115]|nr:hypothetical protein GGI07_005543 [Coemansia sp. Benny D115]